MHPFVDRGSLGAAALQYLRKPQYVFNMGMRKHQSAAGVYALGTRQMSAC